MKTIITKISFRIVFLSLLCCSLQAYTNPAAAAEKTLIFPIPQQMALSDEEFLMDETISIIVPEQKSERDLFLARFLVRELSDKYGLALKIESGKKIPDDRKVVVMGSVENPLIKQYAIDNKLNITADDPGPKATFCMSAARRS